jgi:uncharacterized protein (TIGR03382 family)
MKTGMFIVAAAALSAIAGSANAAAFLTFLDPAGAREVKYTAPTGGATFGTLTATAVVDLQIDLTDSGLGVVLFDNVIYRKTAKVSNATMNGSSFSAEVFDAEFSYTDGANTVLSGTFGTGAGGTANGGDLFINGLSGSISSNADAVGGSLVYNFGAAPIQVGNPGAGSSLSALLATVGLSFGAAIDGNWTLTGISPRPMVFEGGNGQNFIASFDANAAFSGTVDIVPTPGTAALAGLGLIMGLSRRRKA